LPYHHVPEGHLHEDIKAIEREGEVIVAIVRDHDSPRHLHVFTRWVGTQLEVRPGDLRVSS
jgi:hypothetical protein